ncbi:MAG TPA: heavy-metal-associated domain-containing protein [Natronincola sp.]|nr:heavy-metal-associated domain-containing protein [Natronincola sp.]
MTCGHCQKRVEDTLNNLEGLEAKVNLKKEEALITVNGEWNGQTVREAIGEAGYEVVSITDKKSLFGR